MCALGMTLFVNAGGTNPKKLLQLRACHSFLLLVVSLQCLSVSHFYGIANVSLKWIQLEATELRQVDLFVLAADYFSS